MPKPKWEALRTFLRSAHNKARTSTILDNRAKIKNCGLFFFLSVFLHTYLCMPSAGHEKSERHSLSIGLSEFRGFSLAPSLSLDRNLSTLGAHVVPKLEYCLGVRTGCSPLTEAVVLLAMIHLQGAAPLDEAVQDHLVLGMEAFLRFRGSASLTGTIC